MVIHPAQAGSGICFQRLVHGRRVSIPARLESVQPAHRRTILGRGRVTVSTVEHVLAALQGLGIHDAVIRIDGPEAPIMDGSAAPFVRALIRASRPGLGRPTAWALARSVHAIGGQASCHLIPARRLEIFCQVDFKHPLIGRQSLRYEEQGVDYFARRVAPARTFGFLQEAALLHQTGLARGAGLGNVLVYHRGGVLNPGGTRLIDEPVRHKVLDALGDLTLLGAPLRCKIKLIHCSHRLLTSTILSAIQEGVLVRDS